MSSASTDRQDQLGRFRDVRRELEVAVLPLATSIDGRRFTFQASLHGLELRLGGYVVLEQDGVERLGQVLALEQAQRDGAALALPGDVGLTTQVAVRYARGEGALLDGDRTPVHDANVRPAAPEEVAAWLQRTRPARAALEIGSLALAPTVSYALDAGGFDRHTFVCGQSGSGKTYSLGVVLERLLLETGLRIVILDPNSDYVKLASPREGLDAATAERYAQAASGVVVHSGRTDGEQRLRLRIGELSPAAQAALLRLDPVVDRDEHAELAALLAEGTPPTSEALAASARPEAQRLAQRVRNLAVEDFTLWAGHQPGSLLDAVVDPSLRCLVVDLGSLGTRQEQALVAEAVLGRLWERREDRAPVLVVIDEAHNVCPSQPEDALTELATQHAIRIAAEGRKFGLYLMVSTQRPQKVHENVISQCDNLILMRLNSAADAAFAQDVFSFVPATLVEQAAAFGLGEALVAGKLSPHPALIRFGKRYAQEGGSDVPARWAQPVGGGR